MLSNHKSIVYFSSAGRRKSDFPRRSFSQITGNLMERINDLEKRINNCCQDIGKNDGVLQDQVNSKNYNLINFIFLIIWK